MTRRNPAIGVPQGSNLLASQWFSSEYATEIIYQPTSPDISGELEAFYAAARTTAIPAAQGD